MALRNHLILNKKQRMMKIKWREYEAYLIVILTASVIAIDCLKAFTISSSELRCIQSTFSDHAFSLDYATNILFPQLGFQLILLGCYCWLSFYVVRRLRV